MSEINKWESSREKERECIDELVDFMNSSIYAYYILNILAHLIE